MATTINNNPLSQTTTPTTPTPPAEITITESFNHSKEELRKKIEYINDPSDATADIKNLSSSTTTATEEPKAYGWFNNPMSPKHRKRIIKKARKVDRKLNIERISKNYVI